MAAAPDPLRPWHEVEIALVAIHTYANPYRDAEVWADFAHEDGTTLRRPAFWDGGRDWRVRFAAPKAGIWRWTTASTANDSGLAGQSGEIVVGAAEREENRFYRHGFWGMSPGGRNLVHADGRAALLVGDTAWALPWRATEEACAVYAANRQAKGFNAALLMSVQSDMGARGPRDRTQDTGFGIGFEDLADGHINELNADYFRYLDRLLAILVAHEIVPVLQPVFFGFGWKGLGVAGPVVPPAEYARYCRYLVARYGARPTIYLVGADGSGYEPQVGAGGEEIERWDCYRQPTGIHYRPHADNCAAQGATWLDFQWCQTGHSGEHMPERVTDMWRNRPSKAVANGEPSYEHTTVVGRAEGWWQGHEAWSNLCAGGTMGVVYGAAGLWQWKLHPDEPGHADFFLSRGASWRSALDFEGAQYVGLVGKILDGLPLTDIEPNWQVTLGRRGLLVAGKLFIGYASEGGPLMLFGDEVPRSYRVINPCTGEVLREGTRGADDVWIPDEGGEPRVYICYDRG